MQSAQATPSKPLGSRCFAAYAGVAVEVELVAYAFRLIEMFIEVLIVNAECREAHVDSAHLEDGIEI